jgi:predicted nucleic acid-binding protein
MGTPILVDTDVMVDFLRGHKRAVAFVKAHADRILLSVIVVAELYAGARDDLEQEILDDLVGSFRVILVTTELAKAGGLHKRDYGKSHGVGLADGIIAATAQAEGAELKTLNVRHYPMFKGLRPPYEKK